MRGKLVILFACAMVLSLICVNLESVQAQTPQRTQAKPSSEARQFKPKEVKVDRNYDGITDRIEVYDGKGVIVKVESDTDGDGKMDEWVYYENAIPVKGEKDINRDGKADTAIYYDSKGVIIRTETDTNGDGKIDETVYYSGGAPIKAEKDTNRDGKPDTWIAY